MNAPTTNPKAWRVSQLFMPRQWRLALARGLKVELRVELNDDNCIVHPGAFSGLDMDSGRARRGEVPQLRARCEFESGNVRAVTVMPTIGRGDLLWVRTARGSRRNSRLTLEVTGVGVARLQDMNDADALREGVCALDVSRYKVLTPRESFAEFWEDCHGPRSWRLNPWVWIVRFKVHEENVDALLKRWTK